LRTQIIFYNSSAGSQIMTGHWQIELSLAE
jgi:hypothetical protein